METLFDLDAPAAVDERAFDSRIWFDQHGFASPWDPSSAGWEPSPEMMVRLADVDVTQLSPAERVGFVLGWEKCSRYVDAQLAEAIAGAAGDKPEDRASDTTVFELAGLFHQPSAATGKQVDVARDVVDTFGVTLAAVEAGTIPYAFAEAIVELTEGLSWISAQRVEARVLPGAGGRTPAQQRRLLIKAAADYERECHDGPPACPSGQRRVTVRALKPGLASLTLIGPTAQISAAAAAIEGLARAPHQPGDPRTLEHKKFDAAIDLLTGRTSVDVELIVHANPDGTYTLPALPGISDLTAHEIRKLISGGTVRFHDPRIKPPAVDRYAWSAAQLRYLRARDRRCRFPGCGVPAEHCDADHNTPYAQGGQTDVENGCCLCRRHHRMKHQGWTIQLLPDRTAHWTSPTGIHLHDPPHRD